MRLEVILMSLVSLGVISLCLRGTGVRLMRLGVRLMSLGVGLDPPRTRPQLVLHGLFGMLAVRAGPRRIPPVGGPGRGDRVSHHGGLAAARRVPPGSAASALPAPAQSTPAAASAKGARLAETAAAATARHRAQWHPGRPKPGAWYLQVPRKGGNIPVEQSATYCQIAH